MTEQVLSAFASDLLAWWFGGDLLLLLHEPEFSVGGGSSRSPIARAASKYALRLCMCARGALCPLRAWTRLQPLCVHRWWKLCMGRIQRVIRNSRNWSRNGLVPDSITKYIRCDGLVVSSSLFSDLRYERYAHIRTRKKLRTRSLASGSAFACVAASKSCSRSWISSSCFPTTSPCFRWSAWSPQLCSPTYPISKSRTCLWSFPSRKKDPKVTSAIVYVISNRNLFSACAQMLLNQMESLLLKIIFLAFR